MATRSSRSRSAPALAAALLLLLAVPPATAAEDAPPPRESVPSCSACTGSAVKSWRIRKGDPKQPPATKTLKDQGESSDSSDLAE